MALMTSGLAEGGSGADTFILSSSLKGGSIYGGTAGASGDGGRLDEYCQWYFRWCGVWHQGNDSVVVGAGNATKATVLVVQVMTPSPSVVLLHH